MVNLVSAFRSLGTGISNFFSSGFSKITNLFHRIFSRSTPQTSPPDLKGRVTTDGQKSPLLPKSTNGNPPAGAAAKVVQSGSAAKSAKPAEATPPKTKITLSPALTTKSSAVAVAISKGAGAGPALFRKTPPFTVKTATAAAAVKPQASSASKSPTQKKKTTPAAAVKPQAGSALISTTVVKTAIATAAVKPQAGSALISTTVVKTATAAASAGQDLAKLPFCVVEQPKDGNCFFHSLKGGLERLKHPANSQTHLDLRQAMVSKIQETNFSLGTTIFQEIRDLIAKLENDLGGYNVAKKHAQKEGQRIDRSALAQNIIRDLPSYIVSFFQIEKIPLEPGKTIHETYEKLIEGLEGLSCLAIDDSFNNLKFAPVIQSYLGTISKPSCLVNILPAAPLLEALRVRVILHNSDKQFSELASVGPEGAPEVHLVQAGSHFDLLIPN